MSSLLTKIIHRQTLTMVSRRHESALLISGPPIVKMTNKEKLIGLGLFLVIPMIYPIYIMSNLQKYNGSNRTSAKNKKSRSDKKSGH